jgi:Tol biopolymer transport system component
MRKLIVLSLLAALTGLLALPAAAKVSGPNGRILYCNDTGVFTANPDGSQNQLLEPGSCGSWSPDGSRIALVAFTDDGRITTAIVSPTGSGYAPLPFPDPTLSLGPAAGNSWSPDGMRLALQGWDVSDPSRAGVYTASSTDGSRLVRVTSGNDLPADYSPDGARIVFFREDPSRPGLFALFVVGVNGGAVHRITGWQRDAGTASWSPDGQWILSDDAHGGLFVVHADGTDRHQIPLAVSGRAFAKTPGWSPDRKKIVFALITATGPGAGQEVIYTANADGSDVESTGRRGNSPDWGPYPITP